MRTLTARSVAMGFLASAASGNVTLAGSPDDRTAGASALRFMCAVEDGIQWSAAKTSRPRATSPAAKIERVRERGRVDASTAPGTTASDGPGWFIRACQLQGVRQNGGRAVRVGLCQENEH